MDKKLIKRALLILVVIVLSGAFITASFAIDLPWEKGKKEEPREELPPPPKIPDDFSMQPTPTVPAPTWRDGLDGKADPGASSFKRPGIGQPVPPTKVTSWVSGSSGQAAYLGTDDAYIGYSGSRLGAEEGTIIFWYKPIPNLAGVYAKRHESWTDYGQYKPPHSGFLVDTIGWNSAPTGSFSLSLDPSATGGLSFGVWDGGQWHYVNWKTEPGWQWDSEQWYEFGITWGPRGMGILVDGELKASIPDVVSVDNASGWFLGQAPGYWPYGPHTMMGSYDDLQVYSLSML